MGSTIGERIAQIIETKKLKRVQFADELCIDQSYVTQLTTGRRNPSNRLLMSICEKYNVNETWLRTGEGEMFRPMDRREEMARFWEEVSGQGGLGLHRAPGPGAGGGGPGRKWRRVRLGHENSRPGGGRNGCDEGACRGSGGPIREELRDCAQRGIICLEYHRRRR